MKLIRNFIVLLGLSLPATAGAQVATSTLATETATAATETVETATTADDDVVFDAPPIDAELEPPPAPPAPPGEDIEEFVITGSRTKKGLSEALVSTDVVKRTEIQHSGADTLDELLDTQPGILLDRGANTTGIRIQGLNPEQVLVLVDGERVAGRVRDQIDVGRFQLENVERIEIIRGAASALYGSDAMGGVINIISRRPRKPLSSSARAAFGSFNRVDAIGDVGIRQDNISAQLSGGFHRTDAFDLDPDDGNGEVSPTSGDEIQTMTGEGKVIWSADEDTDARLRVQYQRRDLGAIGLEPPRAIIDRNERIETMTISGGPTIDFDGPSSLNISVVHSRYRQQISQDQLGGSDFDDFQDNRQSTNQLILQYDHLFSTESIGDHFVSAGFEGLYETQEVEFLGEDLQNRRRGAVFIQDEWTVVDDLWKLVVVPSFRIDTDSQFGTKPSPRIAVRYDPVDWLLVRASYGQGFRAPTFENLYLQFSNVGSGYRIDGNPNLVPERSHSFNLDSEISVAKGLKVSLVSFLNLVDNLIDTQRYALGEEAPCESRLPGEMISQFCYVNVADAITAGQSVAVSYSYEKYLTAYTSFDYLYTQGTFPNDAVREHELQGRPNVRATLLVTGRVPEWGTRLVVRSAFEGPAEMFVDLDQDGEDDLRDAFVKLDVRVAQDLFGHMTLFAGVKNILDAGQIDHLLIRPRTFFAGLTGRYDIDDVE